MKFKIRKIYTWLFELVKSVWETIFFVFNIPIYIGRLLKSLRVFSKSYNDLTSGIEELKGVLVKPNLPDKIFADGADKLFRLQNEQEKMFSQLFAIFISISALIVSICALLIKK